MKSSPAGQLMSTSARLPDASSPCVISRGAVGRKTPSLARSCILHRPSMTGVLTVHERRKWG
eukprot:scaffold124349_cov57-Phaeocystis_antarctica.AAC.2